MWITDWTTRAACKGTDPDELFVQGAAQNRAKLICRGCPVRTECLADALDNGIEFGVWGGMTERERRALLRRRPDVTSWRDLLERARDEYERSPSTSSSPAERAQPTTGCATLPASRAVPTELCRAQNRPDHPQTGQVVHVFWLGAHLSDGNGRVGRGEVLS